MLTIHLDKRAVEDMLKRLPQEEIPFCTALALTRTAQSAKKVQIQEMRRVFDRPTRFTLNSLVVSRATKTDLTAIVGFKEPRSPASDPGVLAILAGGGKHPHYLLPQVEGGARPMKAVEDRLRSKGILPPGKFAVPGRDARLDSSGNMSRGQLTQIISAVRASREIGYKANVSGSKRSQNTARRNAIFVKRDENRVPIGIWARPGRRGRVRVLLAFVRQPRYTRRYRFYEVGEAHANRALPVEFGKAFDVVMQKHQ